MGRAEEYDAHAVARLHACNVAAHLRPQLQVVDVELEGGVCVGRSCMCHGEEKEV